MKLTTKKRIIYGDIAFYLIFIISLIGSIYLLIKSSTTTASNTDELLDKISTVVYALSVLIMSGLFIQMWQDKKDDIEAKENREESNRLWDKAKKSHEAESKTKLNL